MKRRRTHGSPRQYPRTARLNQLFQEILADELERIDDDRLQLVTVMSVDVDGDLRHATLYYDSPAGEAADEEILEALGQLRGRLQGAIGRQARIKRVPELTFRPDDVQRGAARVEDILRGLDD
jgi:ribosome-binding factor A